MSRVEVLSAVHGIAPRSDELLRLGGDVERGRISQEVYDEQLVQEEVSWLAVQTDAGIDIKESSKLRWQDHLRPIVKASQGFAPDVDNAPVTRRFETNTFYRKPTIVSRLALDYERAKQDIGQPGENISLFSPTSFADLCTDRFTELPARRNVFQLYAELLNFLESSGVKRVIFEDYTANCEHDGAFEYIKTLSDWYPDLQLILLSHHNGSTSPIPWHPIKNLHLGIQPQRLSQISLLPEYRQPDLNGAEIWQTVVDTSTTRPDAIDLSSWDSGFLSFLQPAKLVLTNSADFERLPLVQAQEKVKRLGEFALTVGSHLEKAL